LQKKGEENEAAIQQNLQKRQETKKVETKVETKKR